MRRLRTLLMRLKRLIRWLPVIWRTRDFDYGYVLDILSYSFGELEQHLLDHNIHVTAERDAKRIRYVRKMIERHLNEVSSNMEYAKHDKKWGDTVGVSVPIPNSNFTEWRSVRLNARTPQEQEQETKEFRRAMKKANRLEQRDWHEIWDTIKKYGQGWWC